MKTRKELLLDIKYEILKDLELLAIRLSDYITHRTTICEIERRRCRELRMMNLK